MNVCVMRQKDGVDMCVCVRVRVFVCVCVWVCERERAREMKHGVCLCETVVVDLSCQFWIFLVPHPRRLDR